MVQYSRLRMKYGRRVIKEYQIFNIFYPKYYTYSRLPVHVQVTNIQHVFVAAA